MEPATQKPTDNPGFSGKYLFQKRQISEDNYQLIVPQQKQSIV